MRRAGLIGALALLGVVNAVVLGGVVWNRSGEPQARLRLTERELPLHYSFYRSEEDSGLALRLTLSDGSRSPDWLDENKLRALGFRPERHYAADDTEAGRDKRALPRRAWVVLEFDGPAWRATLEARQQALVELAAKVAAGEATTAQLELRQQDLERLRRSGSRLVAVDAGRNAAQLRARYPDRARYLIVSGELRMWISRSRSAQQRGDGPRVGGYIEQILTRRIHVPLQHRAALHAALGGDLRARRHRDTESLSTPRYAVVLNYGARREPWVGDIVVLDGAEQGRQE